MHLKINITLNCTQSFCIFFRLFRRFLENSDGNFWKTHLLFLPLQKTEFVEEDTNRDPPSERKEDNPEDLMTNHEIEVSINTVISYY